MSLPSHSASLLQNQSSAHSITVLRQVSHLQSTLAELPAGLTSLEADFRAKGGFTHLHRLHHMLYMYGATLVEIVRRKEFSEFIPLLVMKMHTQYHHPLTASSTEFACVSRQVFLRSSADNCRSNGSIDVRRCIKLFLQLPNGKFIVPMSESDAKFTEGKYMANFLLKPRVWTSQRQCSRSPPQVTRPLMCSP